MTRTWRLVFPVIFAVAFSLAAANPPPDQRQEYMKYTRDAITKCDTRAVGLFFDSPLVDPNDMYLSFAVTNAKCKDLGSHLNLIRTMVAKGADPNVGVPFANQPLFQALSMRKKAEPYTGAAYNLANELMILGARPTFPRQPVRLGTSYLWAVNMFIDGRYSSIQLPEAYFLIDAFIRAGADINEFDRLTPILALGAGNQAIFEYFVKNGANPTAKSIDGYYATDLLRIGPASPGHKCYIQRVQDLLPGDKRTFNYLKSTWHVPVSTPENAISKPFPCPRDYHLPDGS